MRDVNINKYQKYLDQFYNHRPTEEIAKDLLGRKLIYHDQNETMAGYIVETEAYLGEKDSTAHAYRGFRSKSIEPLYGYPGTIYVYSMRGRYLFNAIAQDKDIPQGILIRAIEPSDGIELMNNNRKKHGFDLTNGPGKLTEAMGAQTKACNMEYLGESAFDIDIEHKKMPDQIVKGPRIGVSTRGDSTYSELRFYVSGNPYVSKLKKSNRRKNYGWQ